MFIVVLGSILALMHLYIWKRMVKDTTRPGRVRRPVLTLVLALLMLLVGTVVVPADLRMSRSRPGMRGRDICGSASWSTCSWRFWCWSRFGWPCGG